MMPSYYTSNEELDAKEFAHARRHMPVVISTAERERRSLHRFNENLARHYAEQTERIAQMKLEDRDRDFGTHCEMCHKKWADCIAEGCR